MPVRVIHKGDTQHAAHVAKTALCMMAALAVPACLMGMVHARRTIALCSARGNPTPVEVCCMLASWSDSLRSVTQLRLFSAVPAAQGAPSLRIKIGPDSCTFQTLHDSCQLLRVHACVRVCMCVRVRVCVSVCVCVCVCV